jgi:hypothetical protein
VRSPEEILATLPVVEAAGLAATDQVTAAAHDGARTVRELEDGRQEVWRCQATEAFTATEPMKTSDLRQCWQELRGGNWPLFRFLVVLVRGFFMELASQARILRPTPLQGDGTERGGRGKLDLQPGDLVQVRSPQEIQRTLDENGVNRRLSFDREVLPHCGGTYRVKDRVERLIDDRTGK